MFEEKKWARCSKVVARDKHKWESLVMNFYVQLFVLRRRIFWTNIFLKWNISNQVHVLVFCFWLGMPYVSVNDFSFKGCNFTNCKVMFSDKIFMNNTIWNLARQCSFLLGEMCVKFSGKSCDMEPQKAIAPMFFSFASLKVFVVVIFITKLFVYLCFRGRKVFLNFMWWKQSWLLACVFLGVMKGVCCFVVVIFILKLFVCLCFLGRKVFFLYFMWCMRCLGCHERCLLFEPN